MFTLRGCASCLDWVLNDPVGGRLFILGILVYLAVSSWSVGYEFAFTQLWNVVGEDLWLRPSGQSTGSKAGAVGVWVGLGLVRTWFLLCWAIAVVRSRSPRSDARLRGRPSVHQCDFFIWGQRPAIYRDNARRFRFCKLGCRARGEPLADRVYHCSYFATLQAKGQRMDASLDTIKPYLLTILFLLLDALSVIIISFIAISTTTRSSALVHVPAVTRAVAVVIFLASSMLWQKFRDLALRNVTIPEKSHLRMVGCLPGGYWFALLPDHPGDAPIIAHFPGNPWDLGWRRNLGQVFGTRLWDCLLPWTQPPRVRLYTDPRHVTDFEMSDAFWEWVSDKRENRLRTAGSESASSGQERESDAAGTSIVFAGASNVAFSPVSSPRSLSLARPPTSPPPRAPHEIPLPSSPSEL
ncbi:hypothetical protein N8I77_013225 [Diaporthe amygdali]|uniref:Uncharacterized protein n=1 Tax=Phomopsis amygdali TaxID=1214568 RepID=A0AAD9VWI6_PHOAM|nr:hypothetical protein N8I77_013225 [Diaporthe amygdali]